MPAHERLTAAIRAANEDNRPALVPFITAGYPEPGEFVNTLQEIAQVGDVIEIIDGDVVGAALAVDIKCFHRADIQRKRDQV